MRNWNKLNTVLISLALSLAALSIIKIISYKASDRYYYIATISNPKDFPISILGTRFLLDNDDISEASFYKSVDNVNTFYSDWGISEYQEAYKPQFLPKSLFIEYIDYRTKNYYLATIDLPKKKIVSVFKEAKKNKQLKTVNSWNAKMGLEFHVGVANDGNIIFWLLGENYEKEFYSVKLEPKPFPNYIKSYDKEIANKDEFLEQRFKKATDKMKTQLQQEPDKKAQYKDSIPVYFKYLNE